MFLDIFNTILSEIAERSKALEKGFLYLTGKNPLRFVNTQGETVAITPDDARFVYMYLAGSHEFSTSRKKMSSCSSNYDVKHQLTFIVYDECLLNYELAHQYIGYIDSLRANLFSSSNVAITEFSIDRIITALPDLTNAFPQFPSPLNLAIIDTRFKFRYRSEPCIHQDNANCQLREQFKISSLIPYAY
jgi:hypothetical protein